MSLSNLSTEREMHQLRISHEELLLLLGIARLPIPLALGDSPMEGYTSATLRTALASASGSLIARGLLIPTDARGRNPPDIGAGVEPLLADAALAESCLMVVSARDEAQPVVYTTRGDVVVRHTRPLERVHHLERLPDTAAIVTQLQEQITAPEPDGEPLDFAVEAEALMLAVEAVVAGRGQNARGTLLTAGVMVATVDAFLERAGEGLMRYAVLLFSKIQTGKPDLEHLVVLKGNTEAWLVEEADTPADGSSVHVRTLDGHTLRDRIQLLVSAMRGAPPPLA